MKREVKIADNKGGDIRVFRNDDGSMVISVQDQAGSGELSTLVMTSEMFTALCQAINLLTEG